MKKLIFATNNIYKIEEIRNVEGLNFQIQSLSDINFQDTIPEDYDTLKENALQKARYIYDRFGINCFADDTGFEIDALGGRPGVRSARYAGEECNFENNVKKVLEEMQGISKRSARFRTVIALVMDGKEKFFDGVAEGEIIHERRGSGGFGYDPIFIPNNYVPTFAEMSLNEKNKISHRAKAVSKLIDYLKKIGNR